MGAFHAYDIRGIYNTDFDKDTVYRIGRYLPSLIGCTKVLVGRDDRLSSPEIHEWLVKGLNEAGADVYDLGLCTTPMVYYATARYGYDCSVMITASHNPKEYNGLKVSGRNAMPIAYDNGLSTIEEWINSGREFPVSSRRGSVFAFDIMDEYVSFMKSHLEDLSGLRISMDLSNGMASLIAEKVFGDTPIYYICKELDGTFPNHEANPLVAENRRMISEAVLKNGSDVGVIYDGDADRVMFVDENGRFVSPDLMIAVLGNHFFKDGNSGDGKRIVLQDIRSSKAVKEYLAPMGADVHTWKVGRAFAARKLMELDGIYGGELAGHYYFRDFFYSDSGMLASILILDVIADFKRRGVKLSELVSSVSGYENSGELNFRISRKQEAMDAVRDFFTSGEKAEAFYDFDGYRIEFANWWLNIRPSNTEPYLRFIAEASSKELLEEKVSQARRIIEQFI